MEIQKAPSPHADLLTSAQLEGRPSGSDPLEPIVREMMHHLGENTAREGLLRTPSRVAAAMRFLTSGYGMTVEEVVNGALYHEGSSDMVIVKDIAFYSLCEHHMLPFFGKAHIAYVPSNRIIGLSKIPRLVELFSRRLQMQERITAQVADALEEVLSPEAVAVVIEGLHLCMMMRGVEEQEATTITASLRGTFETSSAAREKLFRFIPVNGHSA